MVRPEGFEPPTCGVEDRCSIQLNYRRINLVRVARLELANPKVADFKSAAYTIPPHSHILAESVGIEPTHRITTMTD
jgi:hypothetical protein